MGQYIHKKCDFRHKKGNKISLEISFLLNLKTCKKIRWADGFTGFVSFMVFILYRCKCLARTTFRLSKHVVFEMSI